MAYDTGSLLSDVLIHVRDQFAAASLCPVLCGKALIGSEDDSGNRVLFVPDDGDPEMSPIRIGKTIGAGAQGIAKIKIGCKAYVWGVNDDEDDPYGFTRSMTADITLRNVILSLYDAAPGWIELVKIVNGSNANILSFGAEYVLLFTFTFQINQTPLSSLANVKTRVASRLKTP